MNTSVQAVNIAIEESITSQDITRPTECDEDPNFWWGFHSQKTLLEGGFGFESNIQSREFMEKFASKITLLNITGYFPITGVYAGIKRIRVLIHSKDPILCSLKKEWSKRIPFEIIGLGWIFIPKDAVVTFSRFRVLHPT